MPDTYQQDDPDDAAAETVRRGMLRTILVVDDSRAQRHVVVKLLVDWGYDVLEAATGGEALAHCRDARIDLVLSDWLRPGLNGLELCKAFRAIKGDDYGYFILLSARDGKEDIAQGLEEGADDFLSKPMNPRELRARLVAAERILRMQRDSTLRNRLLRDTLASLQQAETALNRDLGEARRLQESLVPERFRRFSGGDVSLLLRPSGQIGGDLVGLFRISETRIGIYALDVSGHGIASAMMAARLSGYLTASAPERNVAMTIDDMGLYVMRPPDEVCRTLNRLILEDFDSDHYVTMLLADCDLRSGRVRMAQAGHPNPLVQRADGSVEYLGEGGMPVGLLKEAEFDTVDLTLAPGDRLLLHSDGITECESPRGAQFGDDGLARLMTGSHSLRADALLDSLITGLVTHAGTTEFPDDVSCVLFEFSGSR